MEKTKILRYFAGEASESEIREIEKWLLEDTDGSRLSEYKEAHRIFNGITIYSEAPSRKRQKGSPSGTALRWMVAAAAAILIAVVAGNYTHKRTLEELVAKSEVYEIPFGKSMKLVLEDGTSMWMNSLTRVEVPKTFGTRDRTIRLLDGEILLDVVKDERRPFNVKTFAADIKVLGTKFNVIAREDHKEFSTTLLRGVVSIIPAADGETVVMSPDEQVFLGEEGKLELRKVDEAGDMIAWVDGMVNLAGVNFEALMRKFEKSFNTTIVIERKELPRLDISRGKVRISDGIEHALNVLKLSYDFDYLYDYNTNTIIIK